MTQPRPDVAVLLSACRDAGAVEAEALVDECEVYGVAEDTSGRSRRAPSYAWSCAVRVRDGAGREAVVTAAGRLVDGPAALAKAAMAAAAVAPVLSDGGPALRLDVQDRGLGILDLRLPTIEDEDRVETVELNMDGARGVVDGVDPVSFVYEEQRRSRHFAATNGIAVREESSTFTLTGTLRDRRNDGLVLVDRIESRHFADVASVPLGVDLARRLAGYRVTQARSETENGVVVDPLVVAQLLPALAPAFSAERIAAGGSFLAGRLGQAIGSARLHIIDDPGLPGALRTRSFDDRGVPPMAVPLLREGVAESTYLGPRLARQRRQRPTGHERLDGSLWSGNLIVRSGTRSRNMLLPEMGPLLALVDILDLSGVDLVKGTLDLPVRAARMEGAEILGGLGVLRLQCTIEELLRSVVDVCSDQERIRDVDACTWICQGLRVQ